MRKKKYIVGAIFFLIAVMLFLAFKIFPSAINSRFLPTQTSIFTGPVVDQTTIANLRIPQLNGKISREQAIGLAELYCSNANSLPGKNPTNIEASLMTEQEARYQLNAYNEGFSNKPVWLVSMNGQWQHEGPLPENGTRVPLLFNYCAVIIDAETGDMYSLQNKGDN